MESFQRGLFFFSCSSSPDRCLAGLFLPDLSLGLALSSPGMLRWDGGHRKNKAGSAGVTCCMGQLGDTGREVECPLVGKGRVKQPP